MTRSGLRVAVVTSLFPSPPRPREGIFAERRWAALAARGHDVRVIHPQPYAPPSSRRSWREIRSMPRREQRGALPVARPRYLHIPGRAPGNAKRFGRAAWALVADAQLVVCDYAWPAAVLAPRCRAAGLPCLVNGRGSDVLEVSGEAGLGDALAGYLRASSGWCAVSLDLLETMDRLGGAPGRGVLVPNGVDGELFTARDRATCRARLGMEPDHPLVLVVGHLIERKDPLLALEAFARGAPDHAHLAFVGQGPLEEPLREAIEVRGLSGRVQLMGERNPEQLADLYGAADLLLLTSRREGRPNVVLEALASGRPVLATAAGGTPELLGEGPMLCPTRDPDDLARRLADLLSSPPDETELRRSVETLTWESSADTLEALLRDLLEQSS